MIESKQSDGSWPWEITLFLTLPGFNFSGKKVLFNATDNISKEDIY